MATPSGQGLFIVSSTSQITNPINNQTWALVSGSTPALYLYTGNAWTVVATLIVPYIVGGTLIDKPPAEDTILDHPFPLSVSFPADFAGSRAVASIAATASAMFLIEKNGATVGSFTFQASETVATFTSSGQAVTFAATDILTVFSPLQDASLSGIGLALYGTRNN